MKRKRSKNESKQELSKLPAPIICSNLRKLEQEVEWLRQQRKTLRIELQAAQTMMRDHCSAAEKCSECGNCLFCDQDDDLIAYLYDTDDAGEFVCKYCS